MDEKVFKVKFDGVEESIEQSTKLRDIFGNIEETYTKVTKKVEELSVSISDNTKQNKENIKSLTAKQKATEKLKENLSLLGRQIESVNDTVKTFLDIFKLGTNAIELFGLESERTKKILTNISKITEIINTLQSINNALLIKSIGISKSAALMEGVHTMQVRARAIAISLANKNTITATIAQRIFNAVAKANPYVLLATALITVIGALAAFALGSENAAEKQKTLNEAILSQLQLRDQYISTMKKLSDANTNALQRDLDLMKARGASEAQLAQKQREIYEERLKYAKKDSANNKKFIDEIEENAKEVTRYSLEIQKYNNGLAKGIYKNNEAYQKQKEQLESALEIHTQYLNIGLQAQEAEKNALNDLDKFNEETQKKAVEQGKKNSLALAEYRVLMAQKGSKDELIAQIALANQKLKNDLNNTDITNGERLKKTKETQIQIEKLEIDYRKAQIQDTISLIETRLSLVRKGTLEEYNLKITKLDEQKKLDLDNKELSTEKKKLIEKKYLKDIEELGKIYDNNRKEIEINTNISIINTRLASAKSGSNQEYNLKVELAKKIAQLAEEDVKRTIENEELKTAKIKEIRENLQKEIEKLSSNNEISQINKITEKETLALTQQYEARKISKLAYGDAMLNISAKALEEEIKIRKKYGEDTTSLETNLSEIRIKQAENEKTKVTRYFEEMHTNLQKVVDNIMTGVMAIFDAANSVMQSQLDDANEKLETISSKYDEAVSNREESDQKIQELEEKAKNATGTRLIAYRKAIDEEMTANKQLASQEKQLAKDKAKQEAEIAKKEKQQKKVQLMSDIVNATTNIALGVTKALGQWGFPLGPIFASVIAASGAVQIGIMTKQLSKLEDGGLLKGKRHSQGGMRVEGTNIEVEGGEYVVNRESTDKNLGLIRYINSQRKQLTPNDINNYFNRPTYSYEPPFSRQFETGGELPIINNSVNVNNEALVDAIRSVKFEPKVAVTDIMRVQDEMTSVDGWTGM